MAISSPLTITIGAQAYSLKRIGDVGDKGSEYQDNTTVPGTEVNLRISNLYEGKAKSTISGAGYVNSQFERHIVDLKVTVFDENGFGKVTQSYTHIRNLRGADVTAVGNVAQALSAFVTTNADELVAWVSG